MTEYRDNTLLRGLLLEAAAEDLDALLASEDAALAACGGSMEVLLQTLCPGEETK